MKIPQLHQQSKDHPPPLSKGKKKRSPGQAWTVNLSIASLLRDLTVERASQLRHEGRSTHLSTAYIWFSFEERRKEMDVFSYDNYYYYYIKLVI